MVDQAESGTAGLPGILFWPESTPGDHLQDGLFITANYGTKVSGLVGLPPSWVPPFVALPAWLYERWRADPSGWSAQLVTQPVCLSDAFAFLDASSSLIVRSSAVGESMDDRGRYQSVALAGPVGLPDLIAAIAHVYSHFGTDPMPLGIGICIQQYRSPQIAGHVSNEVRFSATRNQWKYGVTLPAFAPLKGLNSKFAVSPNEDQPLALSRSADLSSLLRKVCHWVNKRVASRSHLEWCVSEDELFILQLDEESPRSPGEDPHQMPAIWFPLQPAKYVPSVFSQYRVQDDPKWRKLQNVRDFWTGSEPPRHELYYATGDHLFPLLQSEVGRTRIAAEINSLTGGRAVMRTDCSDPRVPRYNLPRTNTVSGEQAVNWIDDVVRGMSAKSVFSSDLAFILHRYIPARAAAWSYHSVGDDLVVIDCLWGLPDGLQFLEHDSYQIDARSGELLAADVPYKRHFLQEQSDGTWTYVKVARQFGRDRVLSGEALRYIAAETIAIANRVKEQAQVMWFCDIPPELELGSHLPWFRSKDFSQHISVKRPPLPEWRVKNLNDLSEFEAQPNSRILRVDPEVDLVRDDEVFLDRVVEVALRRSAPVELVGSTLGHAYYKLRASGVMVVSGAPTRRRVRRKQIFRKLVRDAMPQTIAANGEQVSYGRLGKAEATTALVGKLFEEAMELQAADSAATQAEELADVFEVIRGLASMMHVEWDQIEDVAGRKREKRGGFDNQTVLMETGRRSKKAPPALNLQPGAQSLVSLRDVGIIRTSNGTTAIPFTRLLASGPLSVEVPLADKSFTLTVSLSTSGIDVRLEEAIEEKVVEPRQGQLF